MKKYLLFFLLLLSVVFLPTLEAAAYVPSDPLYPSQAYLSQIYAPSAWEEARGKGVVVAVLDSGVDVDHPDLEFNIWKNSDEKAGDGIDNDNNGYIDDINGWDFVAEAADPRPKLDEGYSMAGVNHGTAIAGLIGAVANNGKGIAGVAFYSKIMPIRILGSDGTGDVANLIKAIRYAVNNGADIINLSLVGYDYSAELQEAVIWAKNKGVLIVASAGNSSENGGIDLDNQPAYPACYGDNQTNNLVIAVSAVDGADKKSSFTNYGHCIDVSAPGQSLVSLAHYDPANGFNNYYSYDWQGTSFSAALVSGVAALIKSKDLSLSPAEIAEILLLGTDDIYTWNPSFMDELGTGRINAGLALGSDLISGNGYLAKLASGPAVYFVDGRGQRHLFSNEATYWSWHQGSWSKQDIKTISQDEFDSLEAGVNITVRPGTNLIRFENSPRVYAVGTERDVYYLDAEMAARLYGADYLSRTVVVQNAFETDYDRMGQWLNIFYPPATIIAVGSDRYYIDGLTRRPVSEAIFTANKFDANYVIGDPDDSFNYQNGLDLGILPTYEI